MLDSSVGLWEGIQSAGDLVTQTLRALSKSKQERTHQSYCIIRTDMPTQCWSYFPCPLCNHCLLHWVHCTTYLNTLSPRQNGRHFPDNIFKCIFLNENVWIPIKISLNFACKGSISNIPALIQIMTLGRPGDKPLSEPVMVGLRTHICITRPQCVNINICINKSFVW